MTPDQHEHHQSGDLGHTLAMILCCIPMVAIALALVATGALPASFLLIAIACVAMMAVMMRGMDHTQGGH